MSTPNSSLIQIAAALEISPATLSNWQRRFDDFPEPAEMPTPRRRLYRLSDVKEFMARHDLKKGDVETNNNRRLSTEERIVDNFAGQLRGLLPIGPEFVLAVAAIAFRRFPELRVFKKEHGEPHSIEQDIQLGETFLERATTEQIRMIDAGLGNALTELDPEKFAAALRQLLRQISGRHYGGEYTSSPSLATLLSRIANGLEVLDMCSGYGNILREYHRGSRRLVGQEINQTIAAISRVLAFLEGYAVEIYAEDSIYTLHPEWMAQGFDAIAMDPPMGLRMRDEQINPNDLRWNLLAQSRSNQSDDFWIQSALAYLRPSSIELPFRAAIHLRSGWFYEGAEGSMRDALLKSGVVEAVIALGSGASAGTSIPTNILVMRKAGVVTPFVRMVDAREAGRLVKGVREFSKSEIDTIVAALKNSGDANSNSTIKVLDVSITEILENGSVLSVNRYINEAQQIASLDESIRIFDKAMASLQSSIDQLGGTIGQVSAGPLQKVQKVLNTDLLIYSLNAPNISSVPVVSLFKNRQQGKEWTRDEIFPDDVVVCTTGSQVGQAMTGREVLERQVRWTKVWVIRCQSRQIDPRYVASWAKFGGLDIQLRPLITGSTIPTIAKRDLDRVVLPVPSAEVQHVVALWGEMVTSMLNVLDKVGDQGATFASALKNIGASFFNEFKFEGPKK